MTLLVLEEDVKDVFEVEAMTNDLTNRDDLEPDSDGFSHIDT